MFPLPFASLHEQYTAGATDDHGNTVDGWKSPVSRACVWWTPTSGRQYEDESVTTAQVGYDITLVVDSAVSVDHRDRFTVEGRRFEVVGLPANYDHGPFGFTPNRKVVELRYVG